MTADGEIKLEDKMLPISAPDFELLRSSRQIYVDKTDLIYQLVMENVPLFLSRPRRFGKSLLTSVFKSLFAHGLEYFHGLKIEQLWRPEPFCKVLELDLSGFSFSDPDEFESRFLLFCKRCCADAGIAVPADAADPADLLKAVLIEEPPRSVVLLIDEYDSPLMEYLDDAAGFEKIRKSLRSFYLAVKSNQPKLRFIFVTGIARFNQDSLFSAPNSFIDISFDDDYSAIVGFTDAEIEQNFAPFIARKARSLGITPAQVMQELQAHYDGYAFGWGIRQRVYNPWSVLCALKSTDQELPFDAYWAYTGSFTMLRKYMTAAAHSDTMSALLQKLAADKADISLSRAQLKGTINIAEIDPGLMLYQTGALTFRDKLLNQARSLQLPNLEVRSYVVENLYAACAGALQAAQLDAFTEKAKAAFIRCLTSADENGIARCLGQCLNQLTYHEKAYLQTEYDFQVMLNLVLRLSGFQTNIETQLLTGRTDFQITCCDQDNAYCFVFEFKLLYDDDPGLSAQQCRAQQDKLLQQARKQIQSRGYYLSAVPGAQTKCFAVVFSLKNKNVAALCAVNPPA